MITVKLSSHAKVTVGPSAWIQEHTQKITPGGRVLDCASGSGFYALWLASQGFEVVAIDRDQASLDQIKGQQASIHTENIDLEAANRSLDYLGAFDAVVVTNYLCHPFLKKLPTLLNSQGVLIYETFALGNEAFGKPGTPTFYSSLKNYSAFQKTCGFWPLKPESLICQNLLVFRESALFRYNQNHD